MGSGRNSPGKFGTFFIVQFFSAVTKHCHETIRRLRSGLARFALCHGTWRGAWQRRSGHNVKVQLREDDGNTVGFSKSGSAWFRHAYTYMWYHLSVPLQRVKVVQQSHRISDHEHAFEGLSPQLTHLIRDHLQPLITKCCDVERQECQNGPVQSSYISVSENSPFPTPLETRTRVLITAS